MFAAGKVERRRRGISDVMLSSYITPIGMSSSTVVSTPVCTFTHAVHTGFGLHFYSLRSAHIKEPLEPQSVHCMIFLAKLIVVLFFS
jgi:hypothetical protein